MDPHHVSLAATPSLLTHNKLYTFSQPKGTREIGPWDIDSNTSSQFDLFCSEIQGSHSCFQPSQIGDITSNATQQHSVLMSIHNNQQQLRQHIKRESECLMTSSSSKATSLTTVTSMSRNIQPARQQTQLANDSFYAARRRLSNSSDQSRSRNRNLSKAKDQTNIVSQVPLCEIAGFIEPTTPPPPASSITFKQIFIKQNDTCWKFESPSKEEQIEDFKPIESPYKQPEQFQHFSAKRHNISPTSSPYNPLVQESENTPIVPKQFKSANNSPRTSVVIRLQVDCRRNSAVSGQQRKAKESSPYGDTTQIQQAQLHQFIKLKKIQSLRRRFNGNPHTYTSGEEIHNQSKHSKETELPSKSHYFSSDIKNQQLFAETSRDRTDSNNRSVSLGFAFNPIVERNDQQSPSHPSKSPKIMMLKSPNFINTAPSLSPQKHQNQSASPSTSIPQSESKTLQYILAKINKQNKPKDQPTNSQPPQSQHQQQQQQQPITCYLPSLQSSKQPQFSINLQNLEEMKSSVKKPILLLTPQKAESPRVNYDCEDLEKSYLKARHKLLSIKPLSINFSPN